MCKDHSPATLRRRRRTLAPARIGSDDTTTRAVRGKITARSKLNATTQTKALRGQLISGAIIHHMAARIQHTRRTPNNLARRSRALIIVRSISFKRLKSSPSPSADLHRKLSRRTISRRATQLLNETRFDLDVALRRSTCNERSIIGPERH